ncbi:hypothetical protein EV182_000372 [Spiromyces aspiralis]|uniref:Uncharacterized protein n=1 Tax=Spiromyces aspiralis TaxID=68401 RepID=A0ACC1HYQ5_9FUNG|nr:hypothetical protein EV182_000372 [Spiromyces aspiralis]
MSGGDDEGRLAAVSRVKWFDPQDVSLYTVIADRPEPRHLHPLSQKPGAALKDRALSQHQQPVIELFGPAGSAKTALIAALCARAVAPSTITVSADDRSTEACHVSIGGLGVHAVVFDVDGRFNVLHVRDIIRRRLIKAIQETCRVTSLTRGMIHAISQSTGECLARLVLFRPQDSTELVATLATLPGFLAQNGIYQCPLLAIDGIHAWCGVDSLQSQHLRSKMHNSSRWHLTDLFHGGGTVSPTLSFCAPPGDQTHIYRCHLPLHLTSSQHRRPCQAATAREAPQQESTPESTPILRLSSPSASGRGITAATSLGHSAT